MNTAGTAFNIAASLDYGVTETKKVSGVVREQLLRVDFSCSSVNSANFSALEAGDLIHCQGAISHSALSQVAAYSLIIDELASSRPGVKLVTGSVTTNASATIVSGNGATDEDIKITLPVLNLGSTLNFGYTFVLLPSIIPGATYRFDGATVNYTGGNLADSRKYIAALSSTGAVSGVGALPSATFVVNGSSTTLFQGAVGETISIQVTITPSSTTQPLVLTLSQILTGQHGISVVSGTVTSIGNQLANSALFAGDAAAVADTNTDGFVDFVSFNFGTVTGQGPSNGTHPTIVVNILVTIANSSSSVQGAALSFDLALGTYYTKRITGTILEPKLTFTRSYSPPVTNLEAGTEITVSGTVTHNITANNSPAYSLVLTETVISGSFDYTAGSASTSVGLVSITGATLQITVPVFSTVRFFLHRRQLNDVDILFFH